VWKDRFASPCAAWESGFAECNRVLAEIQKGYVVDFKTETGRVVGGYLFTYDKVVFI